MGRNQLARRSGDDRDAIGVLNVEMREETVGFAPALLDLSERTQSQLSRLATVGILFRGSELREELSELSGTEWRGAM